MNRRYLFVLILTWYSFSETNATTYYVDFVNGIDTNNGSTTDTPWKTTAKISSSAYNPGDNIYLKYGSTWNPGSITVSSSGTSGNPITYGAYGTASLGKPIINGNGQYMALDLSNKNYITIQDIEFTNGNSTNLQGTVRINTGTGTTLLRCTVGTGTKDGCTFVNKAYQFLVQDCEFLYNAEIGLRFVSTFDTYVMTSGTITGNTASWNDFTGISLGSMQNFSVTNNIANWNGINEDAAEGHGIRIRSTSSGTSSYNFLVDGNTCQRNADCGIKIAGAEGVTFAHHGTVTNNNCNFNGQVGVGLIGSAYDIYVGSCSANYTGTHTRWLTPIWGTGFEIYGTGTEAFVHDILIENCTANYCIDNGNGDGVGFRYDNNANSITYRYCTAKYGEGAGLSIGRNDVIDYATNTAYYNLFVANNAGNNKTVPSRSGAIRKSRYSRTSLTVNCTNYAGTTGSISTHSIAGLGTFTAITKPSTFVNMINSGASQYGLWQNATAFPNIIEHHNLFYATSTAGNITLDASDLLVDPLYVDAANEDFHLQWNSPCIDAGTPTAGLIPQRDFDNNPIYGLPDLGCFEYQPPFAIGTHTIDITGTATLYADGKWRYKTGTTSGTLASLDIYPTAGRLSGTYSNWMDVDPGTWTASAMAWTETLQWATNTTHIVGGLTNNNVYESWYTKTGGARTFIATHTASSGSITSNYTGGMASTILFEIVHIPAGQILGRVTHSGGTMTRSGGAMTLQ